jgi:hypothetical protein
MTRIERIKNAIVHLNIDKTERRIKRYRSDLLIDNFNLIDWMISLSSLYMNGEYSDDFVKIFELVCSIIPQRINDKIALNLTMSSNHRLLNIVFKYKIEEDNDEDQCQVCMSSFKSMLLRIPCMCNSHIHLSCLNELVSKSGGKCRVCNGSYGCLRIVGTLFYPTVDVYPDPVNKKSYIQATSDNMRLKLAIVYARVDRIIQLLDSFNEDQLKSYVDEADCKNVHRFKNGELLLKDKLYSGITRSMYENEFELIELIINEKLRSCNINVER